MAKNKIKTKKEVLKERPEYGRLISAVIDSVSMASVEDVNNNGISGGYGNFIYYKDTTAFYQKHKKDILTLVKELGESMGEDPLVMISRFVCLMDKPGGKPNYSTLEIAEALYQDNGDNVDTIQNAMAWFAAEEVCRMFER